MSIRYEGDGGDHRFTGTPYFLGAVECWHCNELIDIGESALRDTSCGCEYAHVKCPPVVANGTPKTLGEKPTPTQQNLRLLWAGMVRRYMEDVERGASGIAIVIRGLQHVDGGEQPEYLSVDEWSDLQALVDQASTLFSRLGELATALEA